MTLVSLGFRCRLSASPSAMPLASSSSSIRNSRSRNNPSNRRPNSCSSSKSKWNFCNRRHTCKTPYLRGWRSVPRRPQRHRPRPRFPLPSPFMSLSGFSGNLSSSSKRALSTGMDATTISFCRSSALYISQGARSVREKVPAL